MEMVEPDARPIPATQTPEAHSKDLNERRPLRREFQRAVNSI